MICCCGIKVEEARAELGLKICRACAFAGPDVPRPKGRIIYSHKTAGEIEILKADVYEQNKKYFKPNGAFSAVKNFSRSISK